MSDSAELNPLAPDAMIPSLTSAPPLSRELRLGLVCYGGVSLAVYMHGITVELQRLVAASAVFCRDPWTAENPFPADSTEGVYWEALRQITENNDGVVLRVVVDVIAGTSAGGINGIVLAKALARGVKQDPLREVWFDKASLAKLVLPKTWRFWRKEKAPYWAPLNGKRMSGWAYEALHAMNNQRLAGPVKDLPLVPEGNELDLYVTTTDCAGFRRTIDLHDPESIYDLEYRHLLHFRYDPQADDKDAFGPKDDRVLTLAVRSTSSFPGAFPPVTLAEVEAVAGKFEQAELNRHFNAYFLEESQPASSFFLDGGVLNNRPFDHAVQAIMERTADRQVDRRLLFIEPHPVDVEVDRTAAPGWVRTVLAALTTIPSHQPVADALAELARHNMRAAEIRQLITLMEPRVLELIRTAAEEAPRPDGSYAKALATLELDKIEELANEVRKKAQQAADTSYLAYETIKIGEVLADLSAGLCTLLGYPLGSRHAALVHRLVRRWAMRANYLLDETSAGDKEVVAAHRANAEGRIAFLKVFDVNFRRRRLRFLVRCVNDAYADFASKQPKWRPSLDQVKRGLYDLIRRLREVQSGQWVKDPEYRKLYDQLDRLFGRKAFKELMADAAAAMANEVGATDGATAGTSRASRRLEARLDNYLNSHSEELGAAFDLLAAAIRKKLDEYWQHQQTALLWLMKQSYLPQELLQQMLERYVGYAHWDTVIYPLIAMSRITEPDAVEVIRISTSDTKLLNPTGVEERLKGVLAFHFGAFLKRSYRENDFLWGRLDGAERLLKLLGDVGQQQSGGRLPVPERLIWEGFRAVLDAEAPAMRERAPREVAAKLRAQVGSKLLDPCPSALTRAADSRSA